MARKHFLPFVILLLMGSWGKGRCQSVGIGTTSPNPHAILHIVSPTNNQGLLIPGLTTAQRNNMSLVSPNDNGLIVFDTGDGSFYYWNSNAWHHGLGTAQTNATLTYNSTSHVLTITGGSSVDLSTLADSPEAIDIPVQTITGLSGTTVQEVLEELKDMIVPQTPQQIDKFSKDDADRKLFLSLSGDGVPDHVVDLDKFQLNGSITGTLDNTQISNGSIAPAKLLPGSIGKILRVNGSGVVAWEDYPVASNIGINAIAGLTASNVQTALQQIKALIVPETPQQVDVFSLDNADRKVSLSLSADGQPDKTIDFDKLVLEGVVTGTLDNTQIGAGKITGTMIQPGTAGQLLGTNGLGQVSWTDYPVAGDISITGITGMSAGNVQAALQELKTGLSAASTTQIDKFTFTSATRDVALSLAGDGVPDEVINLDDLPLQGDVTGTVSNTKIPNGAVKPIMISPGSPGQILAIKGDGSVSWEEQSILNLFGAYADNSTIYGAGTALNPLKIKPSGTGNQVMMTSPSGNSVVWKDRYSSVTEYYSIDPTDFIPIYKDNEEDKPGLLVWQNDHTFLSNSTRDKNLQGIVPLHLDQDSRLKELRLYYVDDDPKNMRFIFYRKILDSQSETIISSFDTTGSSPTIKTAILDLGNEVVDNSKYSYRVLVIFDNGKDVKKPNDANQKIYGGRVEYVIDR